MLLEEVKMPHIIEGRFDAKGKHFAIVVSRWNQFIVSKMLDGALDALRRHNATDEDITVAYCPGAFEIPLIVSKYANNEKFDAVIALGAVIRGSTSTF